MPFKSQAQRKMLFATNPKVAKEFAAKTPAGKKLPEHVKGSKSPVAKAKTAKGKALAKAAVKAQNVADAKESIAPAKAGRSEADVLEYVVGGKPCVVDREKGIIRGVKIVGFHSKNGGTYPRAALESALAQYQGSKCNLNHPRRDAPGVDRDVEDRFGTFKNVHLGDDGAYADLHFLRSHPFAARACEAAESMPEAFGFSHNVRTMQVPDGQGGVIHESIVRVRSVDLVADPATTSSMLESHQETSMATPIAPHTQEPDLNTTTAGAGCNMGDGPKTPESDSTGAGEAIEGSPVDETIDAILAQYLPEIKAADKATRKPLLKALKDKIDKAIDLFTDDEETDVEEEGEGENNGGGPEGEEGGSEGETEESAGDKTVVAATSATAAASAATPAAPAKPEWEQAFDVLESVGVSSTPARVKMLLKVPAEDRQELAASWKSSGTTAAKPKPKSGSVMESYRAGEETKQIIALTSETLKNDAMRLMSAAR